MNAIPNDRLGVNSTSTKEAYFIIKGREDMKRFPAPCYEFSIPLNFNAVDDTKCITAPIDGREDIEHTIAPSRQEVDIRFDKP